MWKIRSTAIALLLGVICGAFTWVAQEPRPWNGAAAVRPPVIARPVRPPRPAESPTWAEITVTRREPDILPLVVSQVSLEAPETFTTVLLTDDEATPPAPEFNEEWAKEEEKVGSSSLDFATTWPPPASLIEQLEALAGPTVCSDWANRVAAGLTLLSQTSDLDADDAAVVLGELAQLAEEAPQLAITITSLQDQSRLRAAGYALSRRVAIWRSVNALSQHPLMTETPVAVRGDEMLQRLDMADARLGSDQRSANWRRYLLTGQTRLLAEAGSSADDHQRRRHARSVLRRMEWPGLTTEQRQFLENEEFGRVAEELRAWAAEPFDLRQILETVEAYEGQPSTSLARRIAEERLRLTWAGNPLTDELAFHLEQHYRNANVRGAVSQELLTLLAPEAQTSIDRLRDTIAGAAVRGHSQTNAELAFRVVPDNRRLRLVLEAEGDVATNTRSSKSGAVFISRGQGSFHARKEFVFDGKRISMSPAVAEASVRDGLRGVATEYDNIPLLNVLAQTIARQGHSDARLQVRRESEQKMAWRVASRMDAEAEARLAEMEARVEERLAKPLDRLALFAMPIDLQTSTSRLIARYRLAGDLQLGAHTPRPQAPADSLLSVQVHESAVNNALARLPLAGRDTDLPGLFREVLAAVGASDQAAPDDLPENIELRLADEEPVRVDLLEGQARVTVRLSDLKTDARTWRNVTARAYYAPEANGLSARLARTGVVELTGDHLRMRDQLALRAIFCKVFTERRVTDLIPPHVAQNDKLQDFEVTQMVIRDGWLGFALGPRRTANPGVAMK